MPRNKIAPEPTKAPRKPRAPKIAADAVVIQDAPKAAPPALRAPTPEDMMVQAIDKGMSVESLERIMAMRRELVDEAAKKAYYEALAGFQSHCPEIRKTKIVRETKGDRRGKERYRYAPLDSIIAQTKEARLTWGLSHTMVTEQTPTSVKAICTIHHKEGWSESTSFEVPIDADAYMSAPQKVGAAMTFAKRYAISNGYGIVTGDEDTDATFQEEGGEVLSRDQGGGEEQSPDEVLASIEEKVKELAPAVAEKLAATARRLWTSKNAKALEALEDSVIRQVIAYKAGPIARQGGQG